MSGMQMIVVGIGLVIAAILFIVISFIYRGTKGKSIMKDLQKEYELE